MPAIFISYRRDDSPGHAGRLRESLVQQFGDHAVFFDRSSIRPGQPFPNSIRAALTDCKVVLVLIGRDWNAAKLHALDDWVHREIAIAFEQRKTVVPVLVEDAEMPPAHALPEAIAQFGVCQYVRLTEDYWNAGIAELAQKLNQDHGLRLRSEPAAHQWMIEALPQLVGFATVCMCCVLLVLLFGVVAIFYMTDRTLKVTEFGAITVGIVLVMFAVTRIYGLRSLQR